MDIKTVLNDATKKLAAKKISSARLDAEVILSFVLKKPREYVLAHNERILKPTEQKLCSTLISRRTKYEPIAYLIGEKEFYGLPIKVNKNVLIPRPETELLVSEIICLALPEGSKSTILDIGTGSGSIALALAKNLPKAQILALDASADALHLAKINAKTLRLEISFIKSDLLKSVKSGIIKDSILAANLPYLDKREIKDFPMEIKRGLKYEPQEALYAGKHGTALYEELFKQINSLKFKPSYLVAEIGSNNWKDFFSLAKKYFPQAEISVIKDFANRPRILKIKF